MLSSSWIRQEGPLDTRKAQTLNPVFAAVRLKVYCIARGTGQNVRLLQCQGQKPKCATDVAMERSFMKHSCLSREGWLGC